ncbi:murein hydrolase activator EnvC family protein [Microscilla marina]|uniref:Peptidase M23B, putative n=1 Tax=Microscilla marina ATCC 23134 TaxID=313606 RepID=A1ZNZ9_MICM2|nr:peptidoglycan DD-metalloendopeptidase family protein [Microscilla marina]EAY27791.1 peptidase M23B, putative [Microscilla marina ATCC 23134]
MALRHFFRKKAYLLFLGVAAALVLLFTNHWQGYSQKGKRRKTQLVRQKKQKLKYLKNKISSLKSVSSEKSNHIGQLKIIREQIKAQESLVSELKAEIKLTEVDISKLEEKIKVSEKKLNGLKFAYARMLHVYAKANYNYNHLSLLFSSRNINQLYGRIQYLKQYTKVRKKQANKIRALKISMLNQRNVLKQTVSQKQTLLANKLSEGDTLRSLEKKEKAFIKKLVTKEKKLRRDIRYSRRSVSKLNRLITHVVRGRSRSSTGTRRKGRVGTGRKSAPTVKLSASGKKNAQNFSRQKGRLKYPVSGVIVRGFGTHKHPVFKDVKIESRGVDIQAKKGALVRTVYQGKVSTVATIPGMVGKVVMIQHGNYFTVYAKMKNVRVRPGNVVKTGQVIGKVFTSKGGVSQLQFQIWQNSKLLNPIHWLRR